MNDLGEWIAGHRSKQAAGECTPPHHHYVGPEAMLPHTTPFGPGDGRACISTNANCHVAFEVGTVAACQACIDGCPGCGALLYESWHHDDCPRLAAGLAALASGGDGASEAGSPSHRQSPRQSTG